jgi:hypothetical protein
MGAQLSVQNAHRSVRDGQMTEREPGGRSTGEAVEYGVETELFYCRRGRVFSNTIAVAQDNRGTPEQRAACTSDAFRLCSNYIPDATSVENCLRQKKSQPSVPVGLRAKRRLSGR